MLAVNEATLVSVLLPLAPARSLLERFPEQLAVVLRALEVPEDFVEQELAAMGDGVFAKTADRSLVGTMNELAFLADARRARGRTDDLVEMSVELAGVPCSRLRSSEGRPDRELAALIERWRAGELAPAVPSAAPPSTTAPAPSPPEPPESSARNRARPHELSEADVEAALERIAARDEARARDAEHVVDVLTWGEGPGQLTGRECRTDSGTSSKAWVWRRSWNRMRGTGAACTMRARGGCAVATSLLDHHRPH